jgi:aspartyl aminopeptidase
MAFPTTSMSAADRRDAAESLCAFVDAAPSPFHVAANVAQTLMSAGYLLLDETDAWPALTVALNLVMP